MNRKLICLFLCIVLCLSMLACGKKQAKDPTIPAATGDTTNMEAVPQVTNEAGEEVTSTATGAQKETETTSETQKDTTVTVGESVPNATLPPDVDVIMGVVEGEDDGGIDEDVDIPATQPPAATTPTTQPTEGDSQIGTDFDLRTLTYEQYNAMSGEDQKKVIDMFGSTDDFMRWYKAVEAQYKEAHPDVEIGDGNVNAGDLVG